MGWGVLVPGIVHRYAVRWSVGEPRPAWRDKCDACGSATTWRPRCTSCRTRIGPPVGATISLGATGCGVIAAMLGPRPDLPAFLVLVGLALPLGFVDAAVLRLPDPLVLAAFAAGAGLLATAGLTGGHPGQLVRAGFGALACGAGYGVLALLPGSALGYGDVKLGAVLGLYLGWLGWPALVAGLVGVPVVGAPYAVYRFATAGRRAALPYGPAMLVSALGAVVIMG
jgi:leader peptidase (prepilin peptidase)/N-methyltransferase